MKTLIRRIRGQHAGYSYLTGFGWSCPPCKINAGEPDDPFTTAHDAALGFNKHIDDSHDGVIPDGAYSGEIHWDA